MGSPRRQFTHEEIDTAVRDSFEPAVGKTIVCVRTMTEAEAESWGWDDAPHACLVIDLSDGTALVVSQDEEGNGPGALFGCDVVLQPAEDGDWNE